MYKKSSAKYYQENEERLQKVLNNIEICLKKKNKKIDNMVVNVTTIYQKMEKISWLSIEKINWLSIEKILWRKYALL